jgi:N-acyl-D-amino-acid deacylase
MKADLAVFDPARLADKATFDKPHQYAEGYLHVFVNGEPALRDGKTTGRWSGRVLRGPASVR